MLSSFNVKEFKSDCMQSKYLSGLNLDCKLHLICIIKCLHILMQDENTYLNDV